MCNTQMYDLYIFKMIQTLLKNLLNMIFYINSLYFLASNGPFSIILNTPFRYMYFCCKIFTDFYKENVRMHFYIISNMSRWTVDESIIIVFIILCHVLHN